MATAGAEPPRGGVLARAGRACAIDQAGVRVAVALVDHKRRLVHADVAAARWVSARGHVAAHDVRAARPSERHAPPQSKCACNASQLLMYSRADSLHLSPAPWQVAVQSLNFSAAWATRAVSAAQRMADCDARRPTLDDSDVLAQLGE
jgi:hypothetical protein